MKRYKKSKAVGFDPVLEIHPAWVSLVMKKIDEISFKMVSAKLQRLPWIIREEIKQSGSLRRPGQLWRIEPRSELLN